MTSFRGCHNGLVCVWTVPQDIAVTLQTSSAYSEGWWDQETSAQVGEVDIVFKKLSLLVLKLGKK